MAPVGFDSYVLVCSEMTFRHVSAELSELHIVRCITVLDVIWYD